MATLFDPHYQSQDNSGNPHAGGLLYFYQSGTTNDITVYQDATALTPHAQPVVADASGLFAPIYLSGTNDYKIVLKSSAGVVIQTVDPCQIPSTAGGSQPASDTLDKIDDEGIDVFSGLIYGLTLTSDSGDATNDINVAAGIAIDRTNSEFISLAGDLTKRLDASWAVGDNQGALDTGVIANTTYYVYVIKRTDTGVCDVIISANSTAPTLPTNYSLSRQVGTFARVSGAINLNSFTLTQYTFATEGVASAANFRANSPATKPLIVSTAWDAAAEVTLTDAATIAVDMSTFINAKVTLGDNRTLGQPSNTKVGQSGFIRIIQDGTGSRTLAYHADWKFEGGADPVLTTTASATDILFYQVMATNFVFASLVRGVA